MKKTKIKATPEQLETMRAYWREFKLAEDKFWKEIAYLETNMQKDTDIPGIEFIKDDWCGGEWVGIGNTSRTLKLYQREELEDKQEC